MSDVLEQVDVESIEHLDFEPPCAGCEKAAAFSLTCRSCAAVVLSCQKCLNWYLERNQGLMVFGCMKCGFEPNDFHDLVRIRPLK